MKGSPRILLIDDEAQDRGLSSVVLLRELPEAAIEEVEDATGFARALTRGRIDLVVTEHELAWSDGLKVLAAMRDSRPEVPVVMFTHLKDEEVAVEAMKNGLADYLVKSSKGYLRLPTVAAEVLERANNERLVARSEPWLQTLLDRANVGVFRSTLDERLIEANPALLRLLGADSVQEALEIDLPTHYFHSQGRADLRQRLSKEGELQARVVELERRDGSRVWLNLTEVLLLDVDGDIVVDVLVHDISHLKGPEQDTSERIRELERSNADLSDFASVASHELQEPLRMVEKYSQLLDREAGKSLEGEARRSLEFVLDGAQRMQNLVEDLLRFSRTGRGWQGFEACDCNTAVDQALRNLQAAIEESGTVVKREGLPTILGDPAELVQLFQNLIGNAIKFRGEATPKIRISVLQGEDEWIFSVADNGVGMEQREAASVFKVFKRLRPEVAGSGIGLAVSERIVQRHGGRIWVESAPGKGATFSFTIPIGAREEGGREAIPARIESSRKASG